MQLQKQQMRQVVRDSDSAQRETQAEAKTSQQQSPTKNVSPSKREPTKRLDNQQSASSKKLPEEENDRDASLGVHLPDRLDVGQAERSLKLAAASKDVSLAQATVKPCRVFSLQRPACQQPQPKLTLQRRPDKNPQDSDSDSDSVDSELSDRPANPQQTKETDAKRPSGTAANNRPKATPQRRGSQRTLQHPADLPQPDKPPLQLNKAASEFFGRSPQLAPTPARLPPKSPFVSGLQQKQLPVSRLQTNLNTGKLAMPAKDSAAGAQPSLDDCRLGRPPLRHTPALMDAFQRSPLRPRQLQRPVHAKTLQLARLQPPARVFQQTDRPEDVYLD